MAGTIETNIGEGYDEIVLLSTNNYPLCALTDNCGNNSELEEIFGDAVVVHTVLVSYETIYQNMIPYPHTTDISDDDYYVRRYHLGEGREITLTTDMRIADVIISTLSGATPDGIKLIKTTTMTEDDIDVQYS